MPCEALITLENVSKTYGNEEALKDVNLTLNRGDFMAVSGPNGGGKTTLLRILLRLLKPTEGTVTYFDKEGNPSRHLHIGYLPQKNLIDHRFPITVEQTVVSGLFSGWGLRRPSDWRNRLDEMVQTLGLAQFLHKPIGQLSGGQLQRTLLARAIIARPELIVLDEPLSYVDKHFEQQIYSIVANLAKHSTILLVSHEMTVISAMANRHILVDHTLTTCPLKHHGATVSC